MFENSEDISLRRYLNGANEVEMEKKVSELISKGANVETRDIVGNTVLHIAAACTDNIQIVEKIINASSINFRKEYICAENHFKQNALSLAVEHKRIKVAEYLLNLYNDLKQSYNNISLIYLSAQNNDLKMLAKLVKHKCNIDEQNRRGQTALHFAAKKDNTSFMIQLIVNDAIKEVKDDNGYTPLLIAAKYDNINAVNVLLQNSAVITAMSNEKETILAITVKNNSTNVLKYLINSYNQMVETVNKNDFVSPELKNGSPENGEIIYKLLYETDINLNTLLHLIAKTGKIEIFETLIEFYNDVNIRNFDLQTPLHIAAENGHDEIFEQLLKISTFSLHLPDKNGETPLSIACKKDNNFMIEYVLAKVELVTGLEGRKYHLTMAVETQNILLLKHLIKDTELNYYDYYNNFDEQNQACFKLAIKKYFTEAVLYFINSKNWKCFLRRQKPSEYNSEPKSPIQLLIENMPEIAKIIFDKCVVVEENEDQSQKTVYYFYAFLDDIYYIPREYLVAELFPIVSKYLHVLCPYYLIEEKEKAGKLKSNAKAYDKLSLNIIANHPLSLMIKHRRYDLLSHKLVESYIDFKWNAYAKWIYYMICIYTLIILILSTYVLIDIEKKENPEMIRISNVQIGESILNSTDLFIAWIIGCIHFLLTIFKFYFDFKFSKIRQPVNLRFYYFKYFLSSIFLITLCPPVYFILHVDLQWMVVVCINIWTWFSLLNYLKNAPRFGIYIVMIMQIIKSFLRFAPVFIILLLPFALYFHVFLGKGNTISSFFGIFVQTLVMMIGEFDYSETIASKKSFMVSTIFCLFLFFATILLMNLLIGLAVNDITKIISETSIRRRIMQIHTIQNIEYYMSESLARKFWKGFTKKAIDQESQEGVFKWFGLPKKEIKIEMMKDDSISLLENRIEEMEYTMEKFFEENGKNLVEIRRFLRNDISKLKKFEQNILLNNET